MKDKPPPDPAPERALRRRLHAHGLRFARGAKSLPGLPDLVLPRRRSVIFVLGCFWHGHDCAAGRAAPNFNVGVWAEKIAANGAQHQRDRGALRSAGWQVETVWECQLGQPDVIDALAERLLQR